MTDADWQLVFAVLLVGFVGMAYYLAGPISDTRDSDDGEDDDE
jgi:hypothetical protein